MKELFDVDHIILDSTVNTKQEALTELAQLGYQLGCVSKKEDLLEGFLNREKESSTGFEDGFAIPHARTDKIKKPAILFARYKNGVDWDSIDKKPTVVAIALVIPADKAADMHLTILSEVARKLMDSNFRTAMKSEKDKKKICELLYSIETEQKGATPAAELKTSEPLVLALTACAVGVAHTYLAADKLREVLPKLGYQVKVETHGSDGVRNAITDEEIQKAEVVIVASDIGLDLQRFQGKRVFTCPVSRAIKDPEGLLKDALKNAEVLPITGDFDTKHKSAQANMGIMKHIMAGVSYMVPVVILGGIFIALSIGLSKAIYGVDYKPEEHPGNFFYYLMGIGSTAFSLMIVFLGAFIANSIAGRAAIAPAAVVSMIGNTPDFFFPLPGIPKVETPTGFLGAIFAGLAIGYTVKWINTWKVPKTLQPVMPIFFIPIVVGFVYSMIMMFVIGSTVGWVMSKFSEWITHSWGSVNNISNIAIGLGFGLLIGAMTGFDMGGPINKVAFLTCTGLLNNKIYTPMGAMAVAIPVAPLGMGLATMIFRSQFDKEQKTLGVSAFCMGIIGISEGALPFAIKDPKRAIPCNVITSALAGGIAGLLGIADLAGHGGPIVGLLGALGKGNGADAHLGWGQAWSWTLLALLIMFACGLLNALLYGLLLTMSQGGTPTFIKKINTWNQKVISKFSRKNKTAQKIVMKSYKDFFFLIIVCPVVQEWMHDYKFFNSKWIDFFT